MALSPTDPYATDPSVPRKITPPGVSLDPLITPQIQQPTTAPQPAPAQPAPTSTMKPPSAPNINTIPNAPTGASAIGQLPDGAGGAVTVPPPSMAPPSVVPPMTSFSQDSNLINQQINPAASPRLLGAQGLTDSAVSQALTGPDRAQLGQQYYDTFAQRAQNQFGHALTDATNKAAAHGQIGSGMLTNQYGDLTQQFNLDNTTAASDFATRALEGTIGDRLNNAQLARANENSIYGQGANDRNELRGERGYQQNLAEEAIAQRIAQNQMEQGQQQQNFGDAATLYGLGNLNDPTNAYQNAAGLASGEAASSSADVGTLLRAYLARGQTAGGY
jgi:hypothetical protein